MEAATYLFAWNPRRWSWDKLPRAAARVKRGEEYVEAWGIANKNARRGDRAFLIKLGREPRGIFASGVIQCEPYADLHWETEKAMRGRETAYVDIEWDTLLDPETEDILERRLLDAVGLTGYRWDTRSSGVVVPGETARELERLWAPFAGGRR